MRWVVNITYEAPSKVAKVPPTALPDERVDVGSATICTYHNGFVHAELNLLVDGADTEDEAVALAIPTADQLAGNLGVPQTRTKVAATETPMLTEATAGY